MGAIKKVFRGIFGGGGSSQPQQIKVDPGVTDVSGSAATSADTGDVNTRKRKKTGYSSTILSSSGSDDQRSTLG